MLRKKYVIPLVVILCLCVLFVSFQRKRNFSKANTQSEEDEIMKLNREIRRQGLKWVAGKTSMTMLPPEERRKMLGYIPTPYVDPSEILIVEAPETPTVYLDYRNWNGFDWTTPPKNQSTCNSCWAFTLMGAFESMYKLEHNLPNAWPDGSEMILVRCSGAGSCAAGGSYWDAAGWMITNGAAPESCYPYTPTDGACSACANYPANAWRITDRQWITGFPANITNVKNALQQIGPVMCGFKVYPSFYNYTGGVYSPLQGEEMEGWHAVVVIGFSDEDEAWICKNSWGTGWGDNGFFMMTWNTTSPDLEIRDFVAITGTSLQNSAPVLDAVGNKETKEGVKLEIQLSATDPDGNPLTYSCTNKPDGASFNTATGLFSWTPSYTQGSTATNIYYKDYSVTFGVSDGILSDSEAINIRVYNRKRTKGRF
ncbi:MAG: C1 family peptidase [Candidatus Aminicenantales bacterium]